MGAAISTHSADALVVVDVQRAPAVSAALVSRVAEWSLGDAVVTPGRLADVVFAHRRRSLD